MRIRIGTRKSPLALWQARRVATLLAEREPTLEIELVEIITRGDRFLDAPLAQVGGKGLFVKEIEDRLIDGTIDLAVHSLKDMPADRVEGLCLASIPEREDPRDVFLSSRFASLEDLPKGARLGTSSLRRASQLKALRGDLEIVPIRGNVQTRIEKIERELDGGVLALAGLTRLGLSGHVRETLDLARMLPAVGQGALAIETRESDTSTRSRVEAIEAPGVRIAIAAERAFLVTLGGNCQVPLAAHARIEGGEVHLAALVGEPDGSRTLRFTGIARADRQAAEALGRTAAEQLKVQGALELLAGVPRGDDPRGA